MGFGPLYEAQKEKSVLCRVCCGGGRPHLHAGEAAHGHVAVVADLQQRDAEAPLVGRVPDGRAVLDALRGDPRDTLQTL